MSETTGNVPAADGEPERDWTPTTPDDVQWLREFSAIEHLGLYEEERQRIVAIASALAAAREERDRLRETVQFCHDVLDDVEATSAGAVLRSIEYATRHVLAFPATPGTP